MTGFRDGTFQILVATDIAARGIDVTQISHVINYDMPETVDAYTHRIGRTGRNTRTGDAFTFITGDDEDMVRGIERVLRAKVKRCTLEGFDYKKRRPPGMPSSPGRRARLSAAVTRKKSCPAKCIVKAPRQPATGKG